MALTGGAGSTPGQWHRIGHGVRGSSGNPGVAREGPGMPRPCVACGVGGSARSERPSRGSRFRDAGTVECPRETSVALPGIPRLGGSRVAQRLGKLPIATGGMVLMASVGGEMGPSWGTGSQSDRHYGYRDAAMPRAGVICGETEAKWVEAIP